MIFLPIVLGHLTMHVRAFGLDLSGEEQIIIQRCLNELERQISVHFHGIGTKQERYPDDEFLEVLFEKVASSGLSAHLAESLQYARDSTQRGKQK